MKKEFVEQAKWDAHLHFPKKWARYLALIPAIAIAILLYYATLHVHIDAKLDSTTHIAIDGDNGMLTLIGSLIGLNMVAWTLAWARNRIKQAPVVALVGALVVALVGAPVVALVVALGGALVVALVVEEDD